MTMQQIKELDCFMQEAFNKNAGLFYLMPDEPPMFRIGGNISGMVERGMGDVLTAKQINEIAVMALDEDALKEIGVETGQATVRCTLPGVVDGRMSVSKVDGNYVISVMLLPTCLPDAESIRIPSSILEATKVKTGLILFSGPTGSGKTTSLLCTLDFINQQNPCLICTLEYMAQYRLTSKRAIIQQREIGVDVPDMLTGLSTSLLQGADVLMIGELRTSEEVRMCSLISQNNLVLTQLHSETPEKAIQRIQDIYPEEQAVLLRRILADKLRGVCAQMLLDRADGKGKVASYGVLIPDKEMRQAIIDGGDILKRKKPLPQGCQTMEQDIQNLFEQDSITEQTKEKAIMELCL